MSNTSQTDVFVDSLLGNRPPIGFEHLKHKTGGVLSRMSLDKFIDKEDRRGIKVVAVHARQNLKSMSSGERKKALLQHILASSSDYTVLNNPFDSLDVDALSDPSCALL